MRDDNLTLVKRGYEAFSKGDLDTVREMMAPDCVWRTPGYGPFRAEYTGPDEVIEYFTSLAELSEGTFKSEPEAFFADDERTVALVRNTGTRKGKVMDTYVIHVFRVRDGKLFEVTTFASEPKRNEEFWS
jgi:uncharacterized protein